MKKTIIGLLAAATCATASATVIHFDDLSGDETLPIDAGYAGFNWDNMGTVSAGAYPGSGFEAGAVSQSNVAYNWYGMPATITKADGNAWEYTGAYFTSAWVDQEISFEGWRNGQLLVTSGAFTSAWVDQEISFEGWRNGQLLVTSGAFTLDTTAPRWIQLDWAGIDTLVIYNSSPTAWAMDEFTVPEPGSLALMGVSLAGLLTARRRRKA